MTFEKFKECFEIKEISHPKDNNRSPVIYVKHIDSIRRKLNPVYLTALTMESAIWQLRQIYNNRKIKHYDN